MTSTAVRYGVGAVAVIVVAILALRFLPAANEGSPAGSASQAAASKAPGGFPYGSLAAGDYTVKAGQALVDITLTDGWRSTASWHVSKHAGSGEMYMAFWEMPAGANVYADPCGHVLADPPIGPSAADLAEGLAAMGGVEAATKTPIEIGSYRGELVSFVVSARDTSCAPASFWLWTDSGDAGGVRYAQYRGELDLIWVLDVGGSRLLVLGEAPPDATAADVAELRSIIEAMRPRPAS